MALPGNVNPQDRFQRATYYRALLPQPKTEREAVAGILFEIILGIFGRSALSFKDFGIYNTEYRTVCDLTNRRYFLADHHQSEHYLDRPGKI